MILTAIDPGNHTGWARFADGRLEACGLATEPTGVPMAGHVVIEKPQVYQLRKSKGDPNDLIDLAVLVGRLVQRAPEPDRVSLPTPATWKGQVPKHIHASRILSKLDAYELAVFNAVRCATSAKHNVVDAIGLGLWQVNR